MQESLRIDPPSSSEDDAFYELVAQLCTTDQIKKLLRKHWSRSEKNVKLTNDNKWKLATENLRHAVRSGAVPADEARDLVNRVEENGRQHVFYFEPARDSVRQRLRDGQRLARDLVGDLLPSLPRYGPKEEAFIWADFRLGEPADKPRDWKAKVYGHEVHYHYVGREIIQGGVARRPVEAEEERVVALARWNEPDAGSSDPEIPELLELRVPFEISRTRIEDRVNRLARMLFPAIDFAELEPWNLSRALRRLIMEQDRHSDLYRLGAVRLVDAAGGSAELAPYTPGQSLFQLRERRQAVDLLLSGRGECRDLVVTWLSGGSGGALTRNVTTLIAARKEVWPSWRPEETRAASESRRLEGMLEPALPTWHELVIKSDATPEGVDHVTRQLRSFNR